MFANRTSRPVTVEFPPEGVLALESRHGDDFWMEPTAHPFPKILFPFAGRGRLHIGNRAIPLAAGDIATVPARRPHRIEDQKGDPLSLYVLCIDPRVLESVRGAAGSFVSSAFFRHPPWCAEARGLLRRLLLEQSRPSEGRGAVVLGLAWLLVGQVWRSHGSHRAAPSHPPVTARAELALHRVEAYHRSLAHTFPDETSLDEAAERLGMSRRRFTDLFRRVAGTTWLEAVRTLRIRHARQLLAETDRSIAAIAFESGFRDLSHFYRVFRSAPGGCTPEQWRRRARHA